LENQSGCTIEPSGCVKTSPSSSRQTEPAASRSSIWRRQAQLGRDVTMEQATAIALRESSAAKAAHATLRAEGLGGSNALQKALGR
jgi:hypothetical protein